MSNFSYCIAVDVSCYYESTLAADTPEQALEKAKSMFDQAAGSFEVRWDLGVENQRIVDISSDEGTHYENVQIAEEPETRKPPFTYDEYFGASDNIPVVHVQTDDIAEDQNGPKCRIYLNDEVIYENPPYIGPDGPGAVNNLCVFTRELLKRYYTVKESSEQTGEGMHGHMLDTGFVAWIDNTIHKLEQANNGQRLYKEG